MHALFAADQGRADSLVMGLDVRTKILICLSTSLGVIFLNPPHALGFFALVTMIYVLDLGKFKVAGICYAAICIMWLISIGFMQIMHWISPLIPVAEPSKMMIPFLRTTAMINTVLALALSSRVQNLLTSLKTLRLPIWLYIPCAVMIRFIPSFIKDIRQIHETMRIRGYGLNPVFILIHPLLAVRLLAAPILFRALRSSDDLGVAAELKGVGYGVSLENYKPQYFKKVDVIVLAATALILIIGIGIQVVLGTDAVGLHS